MKTYPITAINLRNTRHARGANGRSVYVDEDMEGLGVVREERRESSRHAFVETRRLRWLPDRSFATFRELLAAVEQLSEEDVVAEKAKWPQLGRTRELDSSTLNRCMRHRDLRATAQTSAIASWIPGDHTHVSLCPACSASLNIETVMEILRERLARIAKSKTATREVRSAAFPSAGSAS